MRITATSGQQSAMDGIRAFMASDANLLTIDGEAGTGKTTMLDMVRDAFPNSIISAPTNKACDVLRQKGFEPTTLDRVINKTIAHSTFRPMTDSEIKLYEENNWTFPLGRMVEEITYEKIEKIDATRPVVTDESSMIGQKQIQQLCRIASKVICVGDSFQLPPVEDKPWFQTRRHDAVLTEVKRTDPHSGITGLARALRRKDPTWCTQDWGDAVTIVPAGQLDLETLKTVDICVAHTNPTCDLYNVTSRELKGLSREPDPYRPVAGDTLLAWYTDRYGGTGITKGATYTVALAAPCNGGYRCQFRELNERRSPIIVAAAKANLMVQKTQNCTPGCYPFSFAQCITAHKSQGSEWNNVLVLAHDYWKRDDPEFWHWFYTATTRAQQHLTVVA